jgi:ABC-type glycerol-3-phosphate transport system substrate-binding protein
MRKILFFLTAAAMLMAACSGGSQKSETTESKTMFTGAKGEVKLMTLDPGHFHAALVQKTMYEMVDSVVHIYAP